MLTAIHALGYETPTPIQAEAIPVVLDGKDVLGVAQTGTGKTAAFSLPMIHRLSEDRYSGQFQPIRGLILTPTRELAIQIEENILDYTKQVKLHTATIFGGVNQKSQVQKLRRGVDIVVATPGRLIDLQEQGHVNLKHLQYFVLDEADTMMDMGFIHDLRRIIKHIPKERQSLFFSATMPPNILEFANTMLRNPVRVEVARESTAAETVDQQMMFVMQADKRDLLVHLLQQPEVETALVFMRTKYGADKVVRYLTKNNLNAAAIHGNKTQPQRERAMQGFRKGRTQHSRRDGHRSAWNRRQRREPRDQLRDPQHLRNLRASHRANRVGPARQAYRLVVCERSGRAQVHGGHPAIDETRSAIDHRSPLAPGETRPRI